MSNKLFLDNKDYDAPYEPSESEDEYSEEEKQMLKEVRQGNKRKVDPKQEVLAFDESPEEDDDDDNDIIGDSDIERGDEDDGIPDSKAWGKQRRSYYNTDFVDQDYSAYNEQEEEQAQQEEEEAKTIQLRLAKQLDEADFFLDAPTGEADSDDGHTDTKTKKLEAKIKLKSDLSNLTQRQKQQLFHKDSPEFAGLVNDFETLLSESEHLLSPIMEYAEEKDLQLPVIDFARTRDNMIMTYCTNVTFYLLLKANRIPIKYHPITKRLAQLKQLLGQLQETYDDVVKPQLEDLLERINSGEEVNIATKSLVEPKPRKKLRMMKEFNEEIGQSSDEEYEDEPMGKRAKLSDEDGASTDQEEGDDEDAEEDENYEAERRGITYQIAKNKGLMPHRKKELRNPRVKHRGKFRKALIRRKGAVRTVRKETTRYGGEVSGIKATVKKGIKIKS